jgi:hypothetical protein
MGAEYRMRAATLKRICNSFNVEKIYCFVCGKPILPHQKVRHNNSGMGKGRIYHLECYRGLFIEC